MQPDIKLTASLIHQVYKGKKQIYELYDLEGEIVGVRLPLIDTPYLRALRYRRLRKRRGG